MKKIIEALLLVGMGMLMTSCGLIKGSSNPTVDKAIEITEKMYPHDNALEEAVEAKLQSATGLEIDLTPSSPEK